MDTKDSDSSGVLPPSMLFRSLASELLASESVHSAEKEVSRNDIQVLKNDDNPLKNDCQISEVDANDFSKTSTPSQNKTESANIIESGLGTIDITSSQNVAVQLQKDSASEIDVIISKNNNVSEKNLHLTDIDTSEPKLDIVHDKDETPNQDSSNCKQNVDVIEEKSEETKTSVEVGEGKKRKKRTLSDVKYQDLDVEMRETVIGYKFGKILENRRKGAEYKMKRRLEIETIEQRQNREMKIKQAEAMGQVPNY